MRSLASLASLAVAATFVAPSAVHARLFWQTYGATVPSPAGCGAGCAWNLNSDYFVPRTCDAGHYDLFSPCKVSHYRSPACKNLHPIYAGYCTPYGPCHYKRRDHVYKKHCGCTPLKDTYGPWHLNKCRKHCGVLKADSCLCGAGCTQAAGCGVCSMVGPLGYFAHDEFAVGMELPNIEPMGGETLGEMAAFPAAMMGGSGQSAGQPASAGASIPALPMPEAGAEFSVPGLFNN